MSNEKANALEVSSKDLSKVKENALNPEQLNFLFQRTPEKHIYERPAKGGGKWKYVTGTYVKKVLNLIFGWDWNFEILNTDINIHAGQCIILGKLTCKTNGREIVKTQFGRSDIKLKRDTDIPLDLGNDLKAAATDCLKKCAAELGIAADVYSPNEFKEIKVVDIDFDEQQDEIIDLLGKCKALQDISEVYDMYKDVIVKDVELVKLFGEKKNELTNENP